MNILFWHKSNMMKYVSDITLVSFAANVQSPSWLLRDMKHRQISNYIRLLSSKLASYIWPVCIFSILKVAQNQSNDRMMAHTAAPSEPCACVCLCVCVCVCVSRYFRGGSVRCDRHTSLNSVETVWVFSLVFSSAPVCHRLPATHTERDSRHSFWWSACGVKWNLSLLGIQMRSHLPHHHPLESWHNHQVSVCVHAHSVSWHAYFSFSL